MQIPLRPVDGVRITTLVDNSFDAIHLRFGPVVAQTVAALAADPPDVLVPAHCTSWSAMQALARELPDAFRPNAVGSRFGFEAAA